VVADVREQLGARLDRVDVVAVQLLGLVAVCAVVGLQLLLGLLDHVAMLALEELELPCDQVAPARAAEHQASSR
jgi:hypothetical protein